MSSTTNLPSFFDNIVGEGAAIYETAGCLGLGETVFITAKLPDYILVHGIDKIDQYLLLSMSHDGTSSIKIMFTPIRVVCNNTLQMALFGSNPKIAIRHSKDARRQLDLAKEILGIAKKSFNEASEYYNIMANVKIDDSLIQRYIVELFLKSEEYVIEQNKIILSDEVSTRKQNIITDVYNTINEGPGQHLDTCKGTVFGLYNGITCYLQNTKEYNSDKQFDANKKMDSMYFGQSASINQKAFENALQLCNV